MLPNTRSLRVRLCLMYCGITMAGLIVLGGASWLYLRHMLESARSATLQRRANRLVRFLDSAAGDVPAGRSMVKMPPEQLAKEIRRFSIASPETEQLQVMDVESGTLYAASPAVPFAWPSSSCISPCIRLATVNGRHIRLFQQAVRAHGRTLRVSIAGQVDEHDSTLHTVLGSYLLILPLALFGSLGGGMLLGARALLPVDRMTRAASRIGIENLGERLPVPHTGDEVQRLAEAWNDLLSRLEGAVTQLRQFTSDISHDLRTAMTVMLASVEVALQRERGTAEYSKTLQVIATECRATAQLLDELLMAERDFRDSASLQDVVPLSEIVEEACEQFRGRLCEKSQRLSMDITHDGWIRGNASLLRRLTVILLDNAVKYTPDHRDIKVALHSIGLRMELIVSDTGNGMSPEVLTKIFDRSFRADRARTREAGGNGLGLAIAKRIVEAHKGEISVSSQIGLGSSFRVQLRCDSLQSFHREHL